MRLFTVKNLLIIIVGGGFFLYIAYEENVLYEPVDATITKVETSCSLGKQERGTLTDTTERGDCTEAAALRDHHPDYRDYFMLRYVTVTFDYISPVDGQRYSGRQTRIWQKDPLPVLGDTYPILAHREEPSRTTRK